MNFYPQFLLVLTCNFQAFNSQFSTLENQKNCHTKFKIFTALYNQKQKECLKFQITKEHHRLINPKKLHIIKPITGNQNLKGHRKTVPALFSPPPHAATNAQRADIGLCALVANLHVPYTSSYSSVVGIFLLILATDFHGFLKAKCGFRVGSKDRHVELFLWLVSEQVGTEERGIKPGVAGKKI